MSVSVCFEFEKDLREENSLSNFVRHSPVQWHKILDIFLTQLEQPPPPPVTYCELFVIL